MPGVAPRVLYTAAGGTHVLALLVAVMFAAEQHWHPFLWLALRRGPIFGAVGLHAFCLPSLRTLHVLGTFSQVPRRCLRWPPTPWDAGAPCSNQKFYISSDGAHTQLCHALDKNWIIEVIRWELNPITRN